MKIAIPSYKRSALIKKRTLAYLSSCGVDSNCVYIFVSNQQEEEEYAYLKKDGYKVVYHKELNNLKEKHNFILDYFQSGERLVVMEDDIKMLMRKNEKKVVQFFDFNSLCEIAWQECDKVGAKLWGLYPMANGMFMKESVSTDLKCITGYVFGIEITKDPFLKCNTENKHDYERSILHYIKHGSIVRINYVAQLSDSFTTAGGLQAQHNTIERCDNEIKGNNYLLKRFPHLIRAHHRVNKVFSRPTELIMKFSISKQGNLDLLAYQKIHDKKINFSYE